MTSAEILQKFADDGFAVVPGFASDEEVRAMRAECAGLVKDMDPAQHLTVFSTTKHDHAFKAKTKSKDYFLDSADKIGFFFEEKSRDEAGYLLVDKDKSINKIGHALHVLCPSFKAVTHSDQVKALSQALGFEDPVVVQSMYIFKQPFIGGTVSPHQDATYLHTEPLREYGVWIALEDATLDNGCLWFQPGSHKRGLLGNYRMIRNPEPDGPTCVFTGEKPAYDDQPFIPVPVKKGDMILIDGTVIHKSEPNTSEKSRHIYTFHVYDQGAAKWSPENWMQPTEANNFTHIYDM